MSPQPREPSLQQHAGQLHLCPRPCSGYIPKLSPVSRRALLQRDRVVRVSPVDIQQTSELEC